MSKLTHVARAIAAWLRRRRQRKQSISAYSPPNMPTISEDIDDADLVNRIVDAYRIAHRTNLGARDSFWFKELAPLKRKDHDVLLSGDRRRIAGILRSPFQSMLCLGFDGGGIDATVEDLRCHLTLVAEAIGAVQLRNPEAAAGSPSNIEDLLLRLDDALGFRIVFPNPFANEPGLVTSRGIATFRAIQALYQAYRIRELVPLGGRVLEIGAGMGRTAYYAWQMGLRDYTIVDLPLTNVMQSYFLGRVLGPETISMLGEPRSQIHIIPQAAFFEKDDQYEIAANIDSMTEMSPSTALAYCLTIKQRTNIFLSINHEANGFAVRHICAQAGLHRRSRTPYWLRSGYADEIYGARN